MRLLNQFSKEPPNTAKQLQFIQNEVCSVLYNTRMPAAISVPADMWGRIGD
jgi:hypothetical protein